MKRQLILEGWNSFRQIAIPPNASKEQARDMRHAYYAGATMLFQSMMNILEPGTEATSKDLEVISAINDELDRYMESLKNDILTKNLPRK